MYRAKRGKGAVAAADDGGAPCSYSRLAGGCAAIQSGEWNGGALWRATWVSRGLFVFFVVICIIESQPSPLYASKVVLIVLTVHIALQIPPSAPFLTVKRGCSRETATADDDQQREHVDLPRRLFQWTPGNHTSSSLRRPDWVGKKKGGFSSYRKSYASPHILACHIHEANHDGRVCRAR
ncbi:hypothetical protein DFJ77DRAFT_475706 [Powellomyces hirtus]|nr:hypothetical protein DFJ77DRAFT_475706 [Powellomyces hirtus]